MNIYIIIVLPVVIDVLELSVHFSILGSPGGTEGAGASAASAGGRPVRGVWTLGRFEGNNLREFQ